MEATPSTPLATQIGNRQTRLGSDNRRIVSAIHVVHSGLFCNNRRRPYWGQNVCLVVKTKNFAPCGLRLNFLPLSLLDVLVNLNSIKVRKAPWCLAMGGAWEELAATQLDWYRPVEPSEPSLTPRAQKPTILSSEVHFPTAREGGSNNASHILYLQGETSLERSGK